MNKTIKSIFDAVTHNVGVTITEITSVGKDIGKTIVTPLPDITEDEHIAGLWQGYLYGTQPRKEMCRRELAELGLLE